MAIEYDEIRITTRREIAVCEGAIRKLKKIIEEMEEKYHKTSIDFLRDYDQSTHPPHGEMTRWHDSCCALDRWQERLAGHWQIMKM